MYDRINYYADLAVMRSEASEIVGGERRTVTDRPRYRFTIRRFERDSGFLLHLHCSMPDLYLSGIQVESEEGNVLYRFQGSDFDIVNCDTHDQDFKEDYASMGWNKSQDLTTVTLDDVNDAAFQFYAGTPNKAAFKAIVIAFCEGFRFSKIADKVAAGTPIDGKELDWSAAGATVVQG